MSLSPVSSAPAVDFDSPPPDASSAPSPLPSSTAASSPPAHALSEYDCASSEGAFNSGAMADEEVRVIQDMKQEVEEVLGEAGEEGKEEEDSETTRRLARLKFVLEKSAVYSSILKERMDEDKARQLAELQAKRRAEKSKVLSKAKATTKHVGQKRTRAESLEAEDTALAPVEEDGAEEEEAPIFQQPALITGATLKPYQLEGLQWMVSLDQNGISGILADEMGLGKTLQTIAFSAYLKEQHNSKPFLVVCPLSVMHNWKDEYEKFAPDIPVCMYHGTPAERAEMRRTVMALPGSTSMNKTKLGRPPKRKGPGRPAKGDKVKAKAVQPKVKATTSASANSTRSLRGPLKASGRSTRGAGKVQEEQSASSLRRSSRARKSIIMVDSDSDDEQEKRRKRKKRNADDEYQEVIDIDALSDEEEEEQEEEEMDVDEPASVSSSKSKAKAPVNDEDPFASFPIVITTYEMIMKDRVHLANYNWGYIVVDEGHRLKNLDCKLMKEIKKYKSAGRMILTGTPLHNNLAELWSLLNFILPDIFDDVDSFQEWFNLPSLQSSLPTSQSSQIISALHAILKPFLLRRLKTDVETSLPPKKEYVLYAPLSLRQREAYENVLGGDIRRWLIEGGTADGVQAKKGEAVEEIKEEEVVKEEEKKGGKMRLRRRKGAKNYAEDGEDDEYFEKLEKDNLDARQPKQIDEKEEARIGREHHFKAKVKQVNNMKLQNVVMQLRKVCSHPFLFDWPIDRDTLHPVLGEELVNASGKMMVLDRLLRELFKRKHKVLLFSQFTTMLDIIEDWATDYMGWNICRIDGSTGPLERREQMNLFQTGGDASDAPILFLLSTRAGGLGINLVAADTVIFYDQDWNPQMDAQAQDRAHRIGQTKPVLIFRLVSAHTIETKIMQRATEKRKLEALVIAKGKFRMPASAASSKKETMAELAASLLRLEGEKIEVVPNTKEGKASVLSDEDLEILLDRSDKVFVERQQGWMSSKVGEEVVDAGRAEAAAGKKAAFVVYQAPVEEGNALAKMLGEEVPE